jgi:hypothetical protein
MFQFMFLRLKWQCRYCSFNSSKHRWFRFSTSTFQLMEKLALAWRLLSFQLIKQGTVTWPNSLFQLTQCRLKISRVYHHFNSYKNLPSKPEWDGFNSSDVAFAWMELSFQLNDVMENIANAPIFQLIDISKRRSTMIKRFNSLKVTNCSPEVEIVSTVSTHSHSIRCSSLI